MSSRIASRASWGARYRNGVGTRPVGSLQKFLHHTVTAQLPTTATVAQERAQMRTVERIGQERFGAGISYTIGVFPSGRMYWGAGIDRIAYHSGPGRNTRGAAIVLVGNTHANDITTQQEDSIVWLLQHGVREKWWSDPAITEGHRDFSSTSCPGDFAYGRIEAINRRARGGSWEDFKRNGLPSGNAPLPEPPPSAPPAPSGNKTVAVMASEVIAGQHGSGHANRRRSLGVTQAVYNQVRAEVNRRAGVPAAPAASKSVGTMAKEVIDGKHGSGHANRRRSLGVSQSVYEQVRAEVNRRAAGGGGGSKSVSQMASEVIAGQHGNGHANRRRSLGVSQAVYNQVRAEVNRGA